ncbi:MAG: hypothetical protein Q8P50_04065 [Bacillota bacterium]|nr:hypothetical protein [Bacillota bacterium]
MIASRQDWDSLGLRPGDELLVDIDHTPLNAVSSQATVLAVVANQYSNSSGRLTVYREDPADAPWPVNTDHYEVWRDLRSHWSFETMVSAASIEMNQNMCGFLDEHVFLVKLPPGEDHHLEGLPTTVRALFDSSRSGG